MDNSIKAIPAVTDWNNKSIHEHDVSKTGLVSKHFPSFCPMHAGMGQLIFDPEQD